MRNVWRRAITQLREQLCRTCFERHAPNRRFQDGKLYENLAAELPRTKSGEHSREGCIKCYELFCGFQWPDGLGYSVARRFHFSELQAHGLLPQYRPRETVASEKELLFRLRSLASWVETHESWITWQCLVGESRSWNLDDENAWQIESAAIEVAGLPVVSHVRSDAKILDQIKSFVKWDWKPLDWARILRRAAEITSKPKEFPSPASLDAWVWWRYPIFRRYQWSANKVREAAEKRFKGRQIADERSFYQYWIRQGLRLNGVKTKAPAPKLWDFVINESMPETLPVTSSDL